MPMIFGRLVGAVTAGIAAGPFGVIFGFIVGYLIDQLLRERYVRHVLTRFYRDPLSRLPRHFDSGSLALIGVSLYLGSLTGPLRRRQVELVRAALPRGTATRRRRLGLDRAIDEAVRLLPTINVPALSFCLRAHIRPAAQRSARKQSAQSEGADGPGLQFPDHAEIAALLRSVVGAEQSTELAKSIENRIAAVCEYLGIDAGEIISSSASGRVRASGRLDSRSCAILGVGEQATAFEIKAVFRQLAGQFHPDSLAGLDEERRARSTEAFIRIKDAYDTLMRELEADTCRST